MPTKNPRLNIVLEKPLYDVIKTLAYGEGISMSLKARDLIQNAIEYSEDAMLTKVAEHRDATFNRKKALCLKKVLSLK
jgi:hypothetical protein